MNDNRYFIEGFEGVERKHAGAQIELPDDWWTFCCDCVFTADAHARAKGLDFVRPLVSDPAADDYLRIVGEHWWTEPRLTIKKSRQIRVTWLLIGLNVWAFLKFEGELIPYKTVKFEYSDQYLRDRFWFIIQHIPPKYRVPRVRYVQGAIEAYHREGDVPTSQIVAIAQGEEQVRQFTFSRLFSDEDASQEHQRESHAAAKPAIDGGGCDLKVSTSKGSGTFFYELREKALDKSVDDSRPVEQLPYGITRHYRNGYCHLWVPYYADGNKRPGTPQGDAWIRSAKAGMTVADWEREMEGNDNIQPGKPVYHCGVGADGTGGLVIKPQSYVPGYYVWCGWDFGYRYGGLVFGQIRPLRDEFNQILRQRLHLLGLVLAEDMTTDELAPIAMAEIERVCPGAVCKHACDFYGGNQRTSRNPKTDVEILRSHNITAISSPAQVKMGVEIGQKLITAGDCEVDPVTCEKVVIALTSGYVLNEHGEIPNEHDKQKQRPWSDIADMFRYLVQHAFAIGKVGGEDEPRVHRPNPMEPAQKPLDRPGGRHGTHYWQGKPVRAVEGPVDDRGREHRGNSVVRPTPPGY